MNERGVPDLKPTTVKQGSEEWELLRTKATTLRCNAYLGKVTYNVCDEPASEEICGRCALRRSCRKPSGDSVSSCLGCL